MTPPAADTAPEARSGTAPETRAAAGHAAGPLWDAIEQLRASARDTAAGNQPAHLRELLAGTVHDALMHARTNDGAAIPDALRELAATIRADVPTDTEDRLPTRLRVLVRLLRRDALEPAWMLAHDNASGRVRPSKSATTWAGGSFLRTELPLPTHIDHGRVFAWLPGFRDPRWNVPDEVYALDPSVLLRECLDGARIRGRTLELFGIGYLTQLTALPEDAVMVVLTAPDGAEHRVRATRARRPDLTKPRGPEQTRLAWGGWTAAVPLAPLAAQPGMWRVELEVATAASSLAHPHPESAGPADLTRRGPLGRQRGALARPSVLASGVHEVAGAVVRITCDADAPPATGRARGGRDAVGPLTLEVKRLPPRTRAIPRPVRKAMRKALARMHSRRQLL